MRTKTDLGNPGNPPRLTPEEAGRGRGAAWDQEGRSCWGGGERAAEKHRKTRGGGSALGGGTWNPRPAVGKVWRGGRKGEGAEGTHRPPTPASPAESRRGGSTSRLGRPARSAAGPHLQLLRRPSPGSPLPRSPPIRSADLCRCKHPPPLCACARSGPNARAPRPSA